MKLTKNDLNEIFKNMERENGPSVAFTFGMSGCDWWDHNGQECIELLLKKLNIRLAKKAKENGKN